METSLSFLPILEDDKSGSSRILGQTIATCLRSLSDVENANHIRELLEAIQELGKEHRDLVILQHFIEEFSESCTRALKINPFSKKSFELAIENYQRHWAGVNDKIAMNFLDHQDLRDKKVLLHSHSGALLAFGRQAIQRDLKLSLFQTKSVPGEEGKFQFEELKEMGHQITLIDDMGVNELIPELDFILFGADQYSEANWVNKTGSKAICKASKEKVPVFLLADSRKKVGQCVVTKSLFEIIPLNMVQALYTENEAIYSGL